MKIMLRSPKELQTVKGFGTSSCWWSQYCAGNAANELSELLYGKDGLGLNIYRYNVGGGFDPDNNRVENMWRRTESLYNFDKTKETGKYNFNSDLTAREFMKLCPYGTSSFAAYRSQQPLAVSHSLCNSSFSAKITLGSPARL